MSDNKKPVEPIEADIASRCAACELEYATGSQYVNHTCRAEVAPSRSAAPSFKDWAEKWAKDFHDTYERSAPAFGYETRKESAKPWADVPENNRKLMIAVCAEVLCRFEKERTALYPPASAAPPSEREAAQRELKDYDPHAIEGESEAFICGFLRGVEARAAVPQAAPLSCLMCGQIGEVAIKHEPSGCYICVTCRELNRAVAAKMFCTNCGSTLTAKDKFMDDMYQCQNCGSACKLAVSGAAAVPAPTREPEEMRSLKADIRQALRYLPPPIRERIQKDLGDGAVATAPPKEG